MIPRTVEKEISTSGLGNSQSFAIKTSAKAFRLLSDTLYSDKIRAVIRELCCNAYDSHVAAGVADKPFKIHLPNEMQPYFAVRDFGTGLSIELVMKLYTTYFESTKEESNDFVGALGLGSKSPFSMVDSFTVTSFYRGTKSSFVAFIGADGTPSINHISDEPTSEENGLLIEMPVNPKDFRQFGEKAEKVLRDFATIPEVTGNKITIQAPTYKSSLVNGEVLLHSYNLGNPVYAVMGQVRYPVDFNIFDETSSFEAICDGSVTMHFELGELDFAPSREALSYDEQTIKNIKEKWQKAVGEVTVELKKIVADAASPFEARKNLKEAISEGGYSSGMRHMTFVKDGEDLEAKDYRVPLKDILPLLPAGVRFQKVSSNRWGKNKRSNVYDHWDISQGLSTREYYVDLDNPVLILVDTKSSFNAQIDMYLDSSDYRTIRYIRVPDATKALADTISAKFGGIPVLRTSELPKPTKEQREKNKTVYTSIEVNDGEGWGEAEVDFKDESDYVYVTNTRGKLDCRWDGSDIRAFVKMTGIDVYNIRYKKDKDKAEALDNWVSLNDKLKEIAAEGTYDKAAYNNYMRMPSSPMASYNRRDYDTFREVYGTAYSKFPAYKEYVKNIRVMNMYAKCNDNLSQAAKYFFNMIGHAKAKPQKKACFEAESNKLQKSEPIFQLTEMYRLRNNKEYFNIVKHYIHKGVK